MKWVESWYISYALLGAAAAGILPILLPVVVAQTSGASQIGLVMAAFSFGGLTAPVWGRLADARRLHKVLLAGGLACTAAASAAFPFTRPFPCASFLRFCRAPVLRPLPPRPTSSL